MNCAAKQIARDQCAISTIRLSAKSCSAKLRHSKSSHQIKPSSSSLERSNCCLSDPFQIMWLIRKALPIYKSIFLKRFFPLSASQICLISCNLDQSSFLLNAFPEHNYIILTGNWVSCSRFQEYIDI